MTTRTINRTISIYDYEVDIDLTAEDVVNEFYGSDMDDVLDEYHLQHPEALVRWINDHALDLSGLAWKKPDPKMCKLTEHQKVHLSAAVDILRAAQSLTGRDFGQTINVLLNIESDMDKGE